MSNEVLYRIVYANGRKGVPRPWRGCSCGRQIGVLGMIASYRKHPTPNVGTPVRVERVS